MARVTSFDVFDTLLVRGLARPVDLFDVAAAAVVGAADDDLDRGARIAEVRRVRRLAEYRAQVRAGTDAVSLEAIYAEMASLESLGIDPAAVMEAELAAEAGEVRPVAAGRALLDGARAAGRRVLFVSDMYLPAAHIRGSLERFALIEPGEPLYVSGEAGVSKRSGGLFRHLLEREGIEAADLLHVGDDPVTDLASPRALGIAVEPFTVARLDRFERAGLERLAGPIDEVSRTVGTLRRARAGRSTTDDSGRYAASLGAGLAGPLFGSFAAWVLRQARHAGIERLHFVSRDGQVLRRVAEELRGPGDPECRYLYGSRQAWLLPSVRRVDPEALAWVLEPEPGTASALLAKLGIEAGEADEAITRHGLAGDRVVDGPATARFWELVGELEPMITERAARERAVVADYFAQEGLAGTGWALVDLGWRMNTQRAVASILGVDPSEVRGFYFGAGRRRVPLAESGHVWPFIVEDDGPDAARLPEAWTWQHRPFIEHVLAPADHGTCTGYQREGSRVEPVLDPERETAAGRAFRSLLQDTATDAARDLREAGLLDRAAPLVRAYGLQSGRLALESPLRSEAEAVSWVTVGDDQLDSRTRELAPALDLREIYLRSRERLGRPVVRDFTNVSRWPAGSAARASRPARAVQGAAGSLRRLARRLR